MTKTPNASKNEFQNQYYIYISSYTQHNIAVQKLQSNWKKYYTIKNLIYTPLGDADVFILIVLDPTTL